METKTPEIIEILSKKENSETALIKDETTGQLYVRKTMPKNDALSQRLPQINSKYFPKIISIENDGKNTIITEEYINGLTLKAAVEMGINFSKKTKLRIIKELCKAAGELHKNGLIHRDIKPSNIMLTDPNSKKPGVMLIDFETLREPKKGLEKDTEILGTEGYAPPEQFGYAQTDKRSDIYSIGVVADKLFEGEKWAKQYKKIINKCCRKDPNNRYKTTGRLHLALTLKNKKRFIALALVFLIMLPRLPYMIYMTANITRDIILYIETKYMGNDDYYYEGVRWNGEYVKGNSHIIIVRKSIDTIIFTIKTIEEDRGYTNTIEQGIMTIDFRVDENRAYYKYGEDQELDFTMSGNKLTVSDSEDGSLFSANIEGTYDYYRGPTYDSRMEKKTDDYYIGLLNSYTGAWKDYYASKCHILVTPKSKQSYIEIHWSAGWADDVVWSMMGELDKDTGHLYYKDCKKELVHINEETNEKEHSIYYENGSGELYFSGGFLYWKDDQENVASENKFVRDSDSIRKIYENE